MTLRLARIGAEARLLIDRAEKRNAFHLDMWRQLPEMLREAQADPAIRLLTIRAAEPGAFSAGADIRELLAHKNDPDWQALNQAAINHAQHELARCGLPTLAFVEGDCIGGGCGIALACDMRVATRAARFGITPAKLGLVYPLHDVKLLVDLVGPGQARRMLFMGELLDAPEAERIGLVEVVREDLGNLVDAILAGSPHSIREIKRFVRRVLDGQVDDDAETSRIFAKAFEGKDFQEGAAAFIEKRQPEFRQ